MKQSPLGSSEPIVDVVVGIGKELGKRPGDATREVTEVSTTEAYGHAHTTHTHTHAHTHTHTSTLTQRHTQAVHSARAKTHMAKPKHTHAKKQTHKPT